MPTPNPIQSGKGQLAGILIEIKRKAGNQREGCYPEGLKYGRKGSAFGKKFTQFWLKTNLWRFFDHGIIVIVFTTRLHFISFS